MEIVRLSKSFKCKCGKEIDVLMASYGNTECFDCLLETDEKEDRDGLNYFLSKAVVKVKDVKIYSTRKKASSRGTVTNLRI